MKGIKNEAAYEAGRTTAEGGGPASANPYRSAADRRDWRTGFDDQVAAKRSDEEFMVLERSQREYVEALTNGWGKPR